jgi:O-antigen/teichoic acid export membrane protein
VVAIGRPRLATWWRLRNKVRHLGWGVADQAVSSVTNSVMVLYVAHRVGSAQFGAFSLAYVTYSFALNASRGLTSDPLMVRFSGVDPSAWRLAVARCTGTAAAAGLATGVGVLAVAALLSSAARFAFLGLGVTLPFLMLQDSWRFAFFAAGRGRQAFVNDLIWAVALVPALLLLRLAGIENVFWFVFAWGAAAGVAAAAGLAQARVMPKLSGSREWLSRHRDLGFRYLAENTSFSCASQLRTYGLGFIAGLAAVGYVQAASTLLGPVMVVLMGMTIVGIPEAARILRRSPQHLLLFCIVVSGGLIVTAVAWGAVLLLVLPRGLGMLLLGPIWRPAYPLVLPYALSIMGLCAWCGAQAGLHALGAARRSLRAMVLASVASLAGALVGALQGGALGSVRGLAVATWIGALLWWWQLRAAMGESGIAPFGHRHGEQHQEPTMESLRRMTASGHADGDAPSPTAGNADGQREHHGKPSSPWDQPQLVPSPGARFERAPPSEPPFQPSFPSATLFPPVPAVSHAPPSGPADPPVPPDPSASPGRSAAPTSSASTTWTVVVDSDRTYYDRIWTTRALSGLPVAFPARGNQRRFVLIGNQMLIGRRSTASAVEPEIDLAAPPADPAVSRLHAFLIAAPDGTWAVLDPGSANGTLLNGRKIAIGNLLPLHEGDRINLGAWTVITVHRG